MGQALAVHHDLDSTLVACGQSRSSVGSPQPADGSACGPGPLAFSALADGGGTIDGADNSGQDVAIWFWAPWCEVCNEEAPEVAQLAKRNSRDIKFLGIAGRDSEGPMQYFVDRYALGFPQVNDTDGAPWASFGVPAQPAWAFVDGQTGQATTFLGPLPADQVEAQLEILRANNG